jgi:hypothetical protein
MPKKRAKKKTPTRKKASAKRVVKKKVANKTAGKKVARKAIKKKTVAKKVARKAIKKKTVINRTTKKAIAKKKKTTKKSVRKKSSTNPLCAKKVIKKPTKKPAPKKKAEKKSAPTKTKVIQVKTEENFELPPKKKRARRKKREMYFTQETEDAIVLFNNTDDQSMRNKIYREKIKYAFEKLAENIFNTFKFSYFDVAPLEVQKQVVSFLVSIIHKYKSQADGGSKAFSYFSVVAKHWLILQNNNTWKHWNRHTEIMDAPDEDTDGQILMVRDNEDVEVKEFVDLFIQFWDINLNKIFNKPKELEIANAVIELFRNREMLEFFNKKTLYLYIREMSDCKTQHITKVINKMKEYQKELTLQYIRGGVIDMNFTINSNKEKAIKI